MLVLVSINRGEVAFKTNLNFRSPPVVLGQILMRKPEYQTLDRSVPTQVKGATLIYGFGIKGSTASTVSPPPTKAG